MTTYSKLNVIYRLQKWMDSVPGQTFLNYAYSWGASIVILGTLFKLTHMDGADFFLFLGMGTEVLVFFLSAFDRPFDKTADGMELDTHVHAGATPTIVGNAGGTINDGAPIVSDGPVVTGGPVVSGGSAGVSGPIVIGGGGAPAGGSGTGGTIIIGGGGSMSSGENVSVEGGSSVGTGSGTVVIGGGGASVSTSAHPELEAATAGYVDELRHLTETLSKVSAQNEKLAHDSEEMENLNRTLTGICKVYEMQLKSASAQIGTIDDINDQTKKMAAQIAELNKIYSRMIEAMTAKMNA